MYVVGRQRFSFAELDNDFSFLCLMLRFKKYKTLHKVYLIYSDKFRSTNGDNVLILFKFIYPTTELAKAFNTNLCCFIALFFSL